MPATALASTAPRVPGAIALLVLVLVLVGPRSAAAAVPSPPNCVTEQVMVGSWNGIAASGSDVPCGPLNPGFDVIVRDVNNAPIGGSVVKLAFAGSGVRPHSVQNAGVTVACPIGTISMLTNPAGVARFSPRLAGYNLANSILVSADGVILASVRAISPDYNADGALTVSDFSTFSTDFLNPAPQPRSDFNNCPTQLLGDYAFFSAQYLAALGQPAAVLCP